METMQQQYDGHTRRRQLWAAAEQIEGSLSCCAEKSAVQSTNYEIRLKRFSRLTRRSEETLQSRYQHQKQ